jgi:hypothetical protein
VKALSLSVLTILMVSASFAHAKAEPTSPTLLRCNLGFGPDQEAQVVVTEEGLVLKELTNSGSMIHRELSVEEWANKAIVLRQDTKYDRGTLEYKDGNWEYKFEGVYGYADCSIDQTR